MVLSNGSQSILDMLVILLVSVVFKIRRKLLFLLATVLGIIIPLVIYCFLTSVYFSYVLIYIFPMTSDRSVTINCCLLNEYMEF